MLRNSSLSTKTLSASLITFALLASVTAQTTRSSVRPMVRQAPQTVLDGFGLKRASLQNLSVPRGQVAGFEVVVDFDGKLHQLVLREHDIRAADFKLIVTGPNGIKVLPTPKSSTYRGVVAGHGDSRVAASLIKGQLTAFVQLRGTETTWTIQPLRKLIATADRATYVVHNARDTRPTPYRCGVDQQTPVPIDAGRPVVNGQGPIYECELALDLDFDEYKRHGSDVIATHYDATLIVNACNVIYSRDVEIEFLLTTIIVRTSRVYNSSNYSTLLSNYRSRWRSNHSGVRRDITHLLTGKYPTSGVIGVAYLSSICSTRNGYGLSFTHFALDVEQRVGLTAHELGHSFGAGHCSGSSCYLMCPSIGGCGGSVTQFGASSKSRIISYRNGRSCLRQRSGNEPRLDLVAPTKVQAFRGGLVTLTGKNFTGATRVTVGITVLTPGTNPLTSFKVVSDTSITFQAPTGESFAPHAVYVQNGAGTSSRLFLAYSVTKPRKLDVESLRRRGETLHWEFGAGPNHNWILTISASSTTFQLLGETWLTTPIVLVGGSLNRAGVGSSSVTVPNNVPIGLTFYSQAVTINPFKNKFGGNTNVTTSRIR